MNSQSSSPGARGSYKGPKQLITKSRVTYGYQSFTFLNHSNQHVKYLGLLSCSYTRKKVLKKGVKKTTQQSGRKGRL